MGNLHLSSNLAIYSSSDGLAKYSDHHRTRKKTEGNVQTTGAFSFLAFLEKCMLNALKKMPQNN